jgi:hypothetical protein
VKPELDENLPRDLAATLGRRHDVETVADERRLLAARVLERLVGGIAVVDETRVRIRRGGGRRGDGERHRSGA